MGVASEVYAKELSSRKHGIPLWYPEPADQYEVRVGDVGHLDEDGQFHRLFNVTVGPDHPYNADGVPQDFEPLQFNRRLFASHDNILPPQPITSNGTDASHIQANVSVDPGAVAGIDLAYKWDSHRSQGAILVLRDTAKKVATFTATAFRSYMRKNHESWYAFAKDPETYGLHTEPEEIILVRGTVKTSAWALAAYTDAGNQAHDITFNAKAGTLAGAGFKWSSSHSSSAQLEQRVGPGDVSRTKPLSRSAGKAVARYKEELPEIEFERSKGWDSSIDAESPSNQCVFIGYYKIKYRFWGVKKISAAGGYDELPPGEDPLQSPSVVADDGEGVEAVPAAPKFRTAVDDVLDYILQSTDAQVAIASDDDVAELLQEQDQPEDFAKYLRDTSPKIDVDEDGMGALSIVEAIRRGHRTAAATAEQRAAEEATLAMERAQRAELMEIENVLRAEAETQALVEGHNLQPLEHQEQQEQQADKQPPVDVPPPSHHPTPTTVSFRDSARLGATGSSLNAEGKLRLCQRANAAVIQSWPHVMLMDKEAEGASVTDMSVCELENSRFLATGCEDCAVRIWDLLHGALVCKLEQHEDTVWAVTFSPDGSRVVSGSADQKAILWDVDQRRAIRELSGHKGDVWTLAYSPNGKLIATGSVDCTVRLWDGRDGAPLKELTGHSAVVMVVLFSPDSTCLVTCADTTGYIWNANDGELRAKLEGHKGIIWSLDFTADSSRVVTGAEDHTSRVWRTDTGEALCILQEHTGPVWTVAFSPDGEEVASGSYDCLVAVCNSYTGDQHQLLGKENPSIINYVAYSKDGEFIASGGADGTVKLWSAKTGERILEFEGHEDKVKKVVFTPDSNKIITSSDDGTVRVWDLVNVFRL